MDNQWTFDMFDSLVAAGDEGLSFDGIVSPREIALQRVGFQFPLPDYLYAGLEVHRPRSTYLPTEVRSIPSSPLAPNDSLVRDDSGSVIKDEIRFPTTTSERLYEGLPRMREEQVHSDNQNIEGLPRLRGEWVPNDEQISSSGQSTQVADDSPSVHDATSPFGFEMRSGAEDPTASQDPAVCDNIDQGNEEPEETLPRMRGEQIYANDEMSPEVYKCSTCKSTPANSRNLVVLIDGTSYKFSPKKSNVRKLSLQIKLDGTQIEQRKYYLKGIGAYENTHLSQLTRVGNAISSVFEMAFGWHVDKNVKDAYAWLVETYQKGDQIYLFGFSRGAYQVRKLASMIHEIGLVRERQEVERAYRIYLTVDHSKRRTSDVVNNFKREFCWERVKVHFVGVWDTVSSVGFNKSDVHVTASASVTNACHFRHALALDECRVKFMPEYFTELNTHRCHVASSRPDESDVKEVWFAGSHSDVGGVNPRLNQLNENDIIGSHPIHAGNVPLLWMRQEAAACGLVFEPDAFASGPHDVDLGREDSLALGWKQLPGMLWWGLLEVLPIRHQATLVSSPFSYSRSIHSSLCFVKRLYTPRATLGDGIDIPIARGGDGRLWVTECQDEEAMTQLITSLLRDREVTLRSLENVLFFLVTRLDSNLLQTIPKPQWSEESIDGHYDFAVFALAIIYDVTSKFSLSENLVRKARESLRRILTDPNEPHSPITLYALRFLTKNEKLRQRFIAHPEVIRALICASKVTAKDRKGILFPLAMDNLGYLISRLPFADVRQTDVIHELTTTGMWSTLGMMAPSHLLASLRMIACLARCKREFPEHEKIKEQIMNLAKKRRGHIGVAAVEALVELSESNAVPAVHFSNILGYLGNTLPPLDVETDSTPVANSTSSTDSTKFLSAIQVAGSAELDEKLMQKLLKVIQSSIAPERTQATLTFLKLWNYPTIQEYFLKTKNIVLDIFLSQMERKESSLLAAYALRTCFGDDTKDFDRVVQPIVAMFVKGWFDGTVGRVEGSKIFRDLLNLGDLTSRKEVIARIVPNLVVKLEGGDPHEVRMSLICLDILGKRNWEDLRSIVDESLKHYLDKSIDFLRKNDRETQGKGARVISALALRQAGERVMMTHRFQITKLLPSSAAELVSLRHSIQAIIAVLYNVFGNETLREAIINTRGYDDFIAFMAAQRWSSLSRLVH